MNKLKSLALEKQATIRPASDEDINKLRGLLNFELNPKYSIFLKDIGSISYDYHETYGLGVPFNYYLNVYNKISDLAKDKLYPKNCLPVLEIGDGSYYLYDNKEDIIYLWNTPNGGIAKVIEKSLEDFLLYILFDSEM